MEFRMENTMNQQSAVAMSRVVRKTTQKKLAWLRLVSWILTIYLVIVALFWDYLRILTTIIVVYVLLTTVFPDQLTAWISRRRSMPGTEQVSAVFTEGQYHITSEAVSATYDYHHITVAAMCGEYYVFVLGKRHCHVFRRSTLTGGTEAEFRSFLEEQTGKPVLDIK